MDEQNIDQKPESQEVDQGISVQADTGEKAEKRKKHPGGRPLKFKSVKELQEKIDAYFDDCDNTVVKRILNKNQEIIAEITRPYTITGLAEFLEVDRHTLVNYQEKEQYFTTIKKAKAKIENCYEERALLGDNNPVVSIFTLKNNYGWKDRHETDVTTDGEKLNTMTYEQAVAILGRNNPSNQDSITK